MLRLCCLTVFALAFSNQSISNTDHQSAPMLAPHSPSVDKSKIKELVEEMSSQPSGKRLNIRTEFATSYTKAGKPKIAIFWNRELADRLSDWKTVSRQSETGLRGRYPWLSTEKFMSLNPARSGSHIISSKYREVRVEPPKREGLGERDDFEFNAGFIGALVENDIVVIDRKTIIRLAQRENSNTANSELISDTIQVETDALVGYADLLAEVLFTPDESSSFGFVFLVSVRNVKSGQIVAKFVSDGTSPEELSSKVVHITTPDGYKVKNLEATTKITLQTVGEQLAYDTMRELTEPLQALVK